MGVVRWTGRSKGPLCYPHLLTSFSVCSKTFVILQLIIWWKTSELGGAITLITITIIIFSNTTLSTKTGLQSLQCYKLCANENVLIALCYKCCAKRRVKNPSHGIRPLGGYPPKTLFLGPFFTKLTERGDTPPHSGRIFPKKTNRK